ncbi:hypothetical protein ANTQUA_LOCUS7811 [Anthophora quadrimaculata]
MTLYLFRYTRCIIHQNIATWTSYFTISTNLPIVSQIMQNSVFDQTTTTTMCRKEKILFQQKNIFFRAVRLTFLQRQAFTRRNIEEFDHL